MAPARAVAAKLLFFDWRHIRCGRLAWLTGAGERLGVGDPRGPQVDVRAEPEYVPHGIRLEAQKAFTTGPVGPWKGWGRTIIEDGMYRSWHLEVDGHVQLGTGAAAHRSSSPSVAVCRIESRDGFSWSEPHRSPLAVAGQRWFDGFTFFVDPAARPDERYKLVYCASFPDGAFDDTVREYRRRHPRYQDERLMGSRRHGMFAAVSPDGLAWTPVERPIMLHASDTDTTVFRDEAMGKYVMYTRLFRNERRWIGRAESDDFLSWGPIEPVVWPRLDGPPDHDLYLNGHTLYPDSPEYRLMFPLVWHRFTERSDVRLYASGDGIAWSEVPGGPVIVPGAPGSWDSEFIGSGKDLLPFGEDRIASPYSGVPYPHKHPRWPAVWDAWSLGWAFWPKDRLCAVVADREGEFWTMPAEPAGQRLRLNFTAPLAGEIRVGIEGVTGRGIEECDPLHGDVRARVVTWQGSPEARVPEGKPVSLHLRLRAAKLFAVEWC